MISVSIPIAVFKIFCGFSVNYQIAARVVVKPSDNIKQCGFSAARMAENGHKLAFAKLNAHAFKGNHLIVARGVFFNNVFKFKH